MVIAVLMVPWLTKNCAFTIRNSLSSKRYYTCDRPSTVTSTTSNRTLQAIKNTLNILVLTFRDYNNTIVILLHKIVISLHKVIILTLVQFPVFHFGVVKQGPEFTQGSIVKGFDSVHLLSGSLLPDNLSTQWTSLILIPR